MPPLKCPPPRAGKQKWRSMPKGEQARPWLPAWVGTCGSGTDEGMSTCSRRSQANLAKATTHAPALADSIPASEYQTSRSGPPCGGYGPCATAGRRPLNQSALPMLEIYGVVVRASPYTPLPSGHPQCVLVLPAPQRDTTKRHTVDVYPPKY